jgi:hypothetical protein
VDVTTPGVPSLGVVATTTKRCCQPPTNFHVSLFLKF